MITLLCDFCCHEPMAAFYPCRSLQDTAMGSCFPVSDYCFDSGAEGFEGWTACETCHQLIERAAIEALAQRAYSLEKERHSESNPIDYYRATFLLFFDHRTGPTYANALEDTS